MTPYEIMLSESQERMLVVARSGYEGKVRDLFSPLGPSLGRHRRGDRRRIGAGPGGRRGRGGDTGSPAHR